MSAVVYVACQNTADAWDVCRVDDDDIWGHYVCGWDLLEPVSPGHTLESAMDMLAKLNDDLKWAKELRK